MRDRPPPETGGSEEELDVLSLFFDDIVGSYFSAEGCVAALRQFFERRDEILEALSYCYIQSHDDDLMKSPGI